MFYIEVKEVPPKYLINLQKIKYNIFEQHDEGNSLSLLLLTDSFFKENATTFLSKQNITSLVWGKERELTNKCKAIYYSTQRIGSDSWLAHCKLNTERQT